ncbi:MAG: hypothetical protein ABL869_14195, partial [Candidatus Nitrotoga sp.]
MFKITEFLKANFWPYFWQETRKFFIATNPWPTEMNATCRMFLVQEQVLFLGHSNKSKIAVESDGTAFLLYCV